MLLNLRKSTTNDGVFKLTTPQIRHLSVVTMRSKNEGNMVGEGSIEGNIWEIAL